MGNILQRLTRGQAKPYASLPRIDWSHPLAAGLKVYAYDLGGTIIDLVNGGLSSRITSTTAAVRKISPFGYGYTYGATATSDEVLLPKSVGATNVTETAPFSCAMGTYYTGTPLVNSVVAGICDNGGSGNGSAVYALIGAATAMFIIFDNSTFDLQFNVALATNTFQTWVSTFPTATTTQLYYNGTVDASQSGNTTTTTFGSGGFVGFNGSGVSPTIQQTGGLGNGFCYYYAAWNRTLTQKEALQLHLDPYCFLIYPEDDFYLVGVVASTFTYGIQNFFDQVQLKRPTEFIQGPFSGTSPAVAGNYFESAMFEPVKLKPTSEFVPGPWAQTSPPVSGNFSFTPFFDTPKLRPSINFDPGPFAQTSPAITAPYITQNFFDPVKLKQPVYFEPGPWANVSPTIVTRYLTQMFLETVKLKQPLDRFQEAPPGTSPAIAGNFFTQPFFDPIRLKPPIVDDKPPLFQPAAVITQIVEQAFFDVVKLRSSVNFDPGPFRQTSPAIAGNYFTQPFFDAVQLRPSIERFQEAFGVPFPPPVLTTSAWFDVVRLLKPIEPFGWSFSVSPPSIVVEQAFFEVVQKLKVVPPIDWVAAGTQVISTIQYALTDWFQAVKLIQPIIDPSLVLFFPPTNPLSPPQYRLLSDHYLATGYALANTIVTEGGLIPVGWIPTNAVEPLNTAAIQRYWNVGPNFNSEQSQDYYPTAFTYNIYVAAPKVFWTGVSGKPGTFILTGAGASLGAKTRG